MSSSLFWISRVSIFVFLLGIDNLAQKVAFSLVIMHKGEAHFTNAQRGRNPACNHRPGKPPPTSLLLHTGPVLDMKNKEVIGYEVSRYIDSELCKRALSNALALRGKHEGLIFHSDRGSQHSSRAYKRMLQENGIEGSMSAPGCPYDNSCAESFFATFFASPRTALNRKTQETVLLPASLHRVRL